MTACSLQRERFVDYAQYPVWGDLQPACKPVMNPKRPDAGRRVGLDRTFPRARSQLPSQAEAQHQLYRRVKIIRIPRGAPQGRAALCFCRLPRHAIAYSPGRIAAAHCAVEAIHPRARRSGIKVSDGPKGTPSLPSAASGRSETATLLRRAFDRDRPEADLARGQQRSCCPRLDVNACHGRAP